MIQKYFEKFVEYYNLPGYDFNINVARLFLCAFLIWKLLSRDFGFFASVPEEIFYLYPYQIYSSNNYILWTGLPILTEILTFHWVHWILPYPDKNFLRIIQALAVLLLSVLAIFGKGHRGATLIATNVLLIYLWGYVMTH